jgi:hypothetical protein
VSGIAHRAWRPLALSVTRVRRVALAAYDNFGVMTKATFIAIVAPRAGAARDTASAPITSPAPQVPLSRCMTRWNSDRTAMDGRLSSAEWLAQRLPLTDRCPHPAEGDMRARNRWAGLTRSRRRRRSGLAMHSHRLHAQIYGLSGGRNPIGLLSLGVVFLRRTLIYVILIRMESNEV